MTTNQQIRKDEMLKLIANQYVTNVRKPRVDVNKNMANVSQKSWIMTDQVDVAKKMFEINSYSGGLS